MDVPEDPPHPTPADTRIETIQNTQLSRIVFIRNLH